MSEKISFNFRRAVKTRRRKEYSKALKVDQNDLDSDVNFEDYQSDGYFEDSIGVRDYRKDLITSNAGGGNLMTSDYTQIFLNTKSKREFKGALTNQASFDNSDLNIVKYYEGVQRIDEAPKILKMKIIGEDKRIQNDQMVKKVVQVCVVTTGIPDVTVVEKDNLDGEYQGTVNHANGDLAKTVEMSKHYRLKHCLRQYTDIKASLNKTYQEFMNHSQIVAFLEKEKEKDKQRQDLSLDMSKNFMQSKELFSKTKDFKKLIPNRINDGDDIMLLDPETQEELQMLKEYYEATKREIQQNTNEGLDVSKLVEQREETLFKIEKIQYSRYGQMTDQQFQNAQFRKIPGFKNINKNIMEKYKNLVTLEQNRDESPSPNEDEKKEEDCFSKHTRTEMKNNLIQNIRLAINSNQYVKNGRCVACNRNVNEKSDSDSELRTPKKTRAQKKAEAFADLEKQQKDMNYEPYPEIKIPPDFVIKFEIEKGYEPGEQLKFAGRQIRDELVIRFLQAQYKRLELYHEQEMREMEIRIRHKMHGYARACLQTMALELKGEFKAILTQFDLFKEIEYQNKLKILEQNQRLQQQEQIITDLLSFIKWDEAAHEQFTIILKNQGVSVGDLTKTAINQTLVLKTLGIKKYYEKLTDNEKDALDITRPFRLYTNSIRLSTFEKLNLLERETVQFYSRKLQNTLVQIEHYESQTEGYNKYQEVMAKQKNQLQSQLVSVQTDLEITQQKWDQDKKEREKLLQETIKEYKDKIENMKNEWTLLNQMLSDELKLKEQILQKTIKEKEHQEQLNQKLRLQLQIPRAHLNFIKDQGKLDEFIEAKLTGQDVVAKWCLLNTAQQQINKIQQAAAAAKKEVVPIEVRRSKEPQHKSFYVDEDMRFIRLSTEPGKSRNFQKIENIQSSNPMKQSRTEQVDAISIQDFQKPLIKFRHPKSTARLNTEASVQSSVYTLKQKQLKTMNLSPVSARKFLTFNELSGGHKTPLLSERLTRQHLISTSIPGQRTLKQIN